MTLNYHHNLKDQKKYPIHLNSTSSTKLPSSLEHFSASLCFLSITYTYPTILIDINTFLDI